MDPKRQKDISQEFEGDSYAYEKHYDLDSLYSQASDYGKGEKGTLEDADVYGFFDVDVEHA